MNCTARFQSADTFDASSFQLLYPKSIFGCLGLVMVDNEPFICVITECSALGVIEKSTIYSIDNVMFFSLTTNKYDQISENGLSYIQAKEFQQTFQTDYGYDSQGTEQYESIRHPCNQIQRFLSSGSFYFSYDFDLTRTAQVRYQSPDGMSFWETSDDRYFWNQHMIKELLKFRRQLPESDQAQLDQEGLLVMATSGFVAIKEARVYSDPATIAVISRLSCKRAGTRFNTRGVDDDGMVANFVETELLFYVRGMVFSYLILRGSVPLFWEQQGLQLGQHKIQLSRSAAATQPAFERHFNDLLVRYGNQHVVNLLSQKEGSAESLLSDSYVQQVRHLKNELIRMTNFDFHAVAKNNQYESVSVVLNDLRFSLKDFGYFLFDLNRREVLHQQSGTFRVNCLDCLDRTNVVQGLICKSSLNAFTQSTMNVAAESMFSVYLNDMWADNGDELSRIYTGTGALKSGFTRTGKRTLLGLMDDAKKSAARFYMNNFQDKSKQETIDQILGKSAQPEIRLHNPIREAVFHVLNTRFAEWASKTPIRVQIGTWNVNGKQPLGESLITWLTPSRNNNGPPPDMFILGFQEIVELSPQQIMATDNTKRLVWEDLLLKTINSLSQSHQYILLKSGQLVGAALCIFVRAEHAANIRNVQGAIKKTGLAGLAGNKGGVGISLEFYDTSVCFVCAHLAAGQSNVVDRNNDYHTINDGLVFGRGKRILDHDCVFWLGDFNYRIDLANEHVRSTVAKGDYRYLFQYDQLHVEMKRGEVFNGFTEGQITFAPTYRYDAGSNNYDTSEKSRIPAWTDRVLFQGVGINQLAYERAELLSSDHKPVKACFRIELKIVNKNAREQIQKELYKRFADPVALQQFFRQQFKQQVSAPMNSNKRSHVAEGMLIDLSDTGTPVTANGGNAATAPPKLPPRPSNNNFFDELNNEVPPVAKKSSGVAMSNQQIPPPNPFMSVDVPSGNQQKKVPPPIPPRAKTAPNPFQEVVQDPLVDPWRLQ